MNDYWKALENICKIKKDRSILLLLIIFFLVCLSVAAFYFGVWDDRNSMLDDCSMGYVKCTCFRDTTGQLDHIVTPRFKDLNDHINWDEGIDKKS